MGNSKRVFWAAASLVLGVAVGVFVHYLIYRLSLPTEPFILRKLLTAFVEPRNVSAGTLSGLSAPLPGRAKHF